MAEPLPHVDTPDNPPREGPAQADVERRVASLELAQQLTVAQIMRHDLVRIDVDATLQEAQAVLAQHDIHHLLVYNHGHLVGVLSDRDVLLHLSPFLGTPSEQTRDLRTLHRRVYQIATYHPTTIRPDTPVLQAAALLLSHGFSSLPVVDAEGTVVGMVTTRDLLRGIVECVLPVCPPSTEAA